MFRLASVQFDFPPRSAGNPISGMLPERRLTGIVLGLWLVLLLPGCNRGESQADSGAGRRYREAITLIHAGKPPAPGQVGDQLAEIDARIAEIKATLAEIGGEVARGESRLEAAQARSESAGTERQADKSSATTSKTAPETKQAAAKYFHAKKALPTKALWRSEVWSDEQAPGITIALRSNMGSVVSFRCLNVANEPVFNLVFSVLPYELKSAFPTQMIYSRISFPDGKSQIPAVVAHVSIEKGTVLLRLTQPQSKLFRTYLARSDGQFSLNWASAVPLEQGFEEKQRDALIVLSALKAQGPLAIDAPNETHGPIKNLLGVYHQACLGETDGEPALRVASGWLYDPGMLMKSWVAPSLRYGGGRLHIECMVMGSAKSALVKLVAHPYDYLNSPANSLMFTFPSGERYQVNAETDRQNWQLKASLDLPSVRRLVQKLGAERGELKVGWGKKHISVPMTANRVDLQDFLARCK